MHAFNAGNGFGLAVAAALVKKVEIDCCFLAEDPSCDERWVEVILTVAGNPRGPYIVIFLTTCLLLSPIKSGNLKD